MNYKIIKGIFVGFGKAAKFGAAFWSVIFMDVNWLNYSEISEAIQRYKLKNPRQFVEGFVSQARHKNHQYLWSKIKSSFLARRKGTNARCPPYTFSDKVRLKISKKLPKRD